MNSGNKTEKQKTNNKTKGIPLITAAILITAVCLRAPITGVGSMVSLIRADLGLSNGGAGMLTTIPLLVFAALSIPVERIAARISAGRCMFCGMVLLAAGIAARSLLGSSGMYAGTLMIAVGIASGNVLLPGFVKAYYPARVGLLTGIYATIMSAMGGVSTGISMPFADRAGWQTALLIWILAAVPACIAWIPSLGRSAEGAPDGGSDRLPERRDGAAAPEAHAKSGRRPSVATSGMAWAIVFFFGIQSLVFYSFVAWLPSVMAEKGFDPETAGYFSSVFILVGIPATFLVPIFSAREGDECVLNLVIGIMFTAGLVLLIISSDPVILATALVLSGLAVGACFSQSMALFGLRTRDARDAAALSGLAQSVGYLFAAVGPAFAGWIFDETGTWLLPLSGMTVLAAIEAILGWIVGREKIIHG